MGALDEEHNELDNGVSSGCNELAVVEEVEDVVAIEDAVKVLLTGLGEDINRDGLRKTPFRVAKAFKEGTRGYKHKVKDIIQGALFHVPGFNNSTDHTGSTNGLVIVHDLDLFSYCESCLLPFHVKCHVGYIPSDERVIGLSKISRTADVFAKRLQEPQRLADEVCVALHTGIKPQGLAVLLQCSHIHFPSSQPELPDPNWVKISVSAGSGTFQNRKAVEWDDFMNLLKLKGVKGVHMEKIHWCSCECSTSIDPKMAAAVASIIRSLGEDPSRKELSSTSNRYLSWLMHFKDNMEADFLSVSNGMSRSGDAEEVLGELSLPFWSLCEHHLLPFHGVVHIGYIHQPVGRSVLQSVVWARGSRIQVQERMTREIAETVLPLLGGDVIVVVEGIHMCMISRGVEKLGSSTTTVTVFGRFSMDPAARELFLGMVPRSLAGN